MKLLNFKPSGDNNNKFIENDTEGQFLKNCRRLPKDWPWRTIDVNYTVNSQGYRCQEWELIDWSNSILLFGCSLIFGTGIDDTHTCAYQLSLLQNKPVVNLGRASTSPLFQWANSCILNENNITPKVVIYVWPQSIRGTEFCNDKIVKNYGAWSNTMWVNATEKHNAELLKYLITSSSTLWSCPVLHYTSEHQDSKISDRLKLLDLGPNDYARDWDGTIAHPGPMTNKYWAENISKDLNGLW